MDFNEIFHIKLSKTFNVIFAVNAGTYVLNINILV